MASHAYASSSLASSAPALLFLVFLISCLAAAAQSKLPPSSPEGLLKQMTKELNDGTFMPVVGLGTWKSQPNEVEAAVYHAVCNAGYRHIDAAQIYGNQDEVGRGLARAFKDCGVSRKDVWVTSKVWMVDFAPKDVSGAVDRILRELGLDYVDQLLLHWPVSFRKPPPGCPPACSAPFEGTDDAMRPRDKDGNVVNGKLDLAETWAALGKTKKAGKVRSIGVSNFNAEEIQNLVKGGEPLPAVNQVEAHVFWNQQSLIRDMEVLGITVVAYTPLGNPSLYGERSGIVSDLVLSVAKDSDLTPAQVMLNFLITKGCVVVPKSVTPERIDSNIHFALKLTPEQMAKLEKAPQQRLTNPKIRPGGQPIFDDKRHTDEL